MKLNKITNMEYSDPKVRLTGYPPYAAIICRDIILPLGQNMAKICAESSITHLF
jgi:hypothetical protein